MDNTCIDCVIVPQDNHSNNQGLGFFIYKPQDAFGYQKREEFKGGRLSMLYTKAIILPPKYLFRSTVNMEGWHIKDIITTTGNKEEYWEKIEVPLEPRDTKAL